MTTTMLLTLVTVAVLGLVFSALYSGMETGLYTMSRVKLALRRHEGDTRAVRVGLLLDRPARMLAVVLLGTNIANSAGSSALAWLLEGSGMGDGMVVLVNTLVLVPLILLFGEILPKDLFRQHGDRWCYTFAPVLVWTRRVLTVCGVVPLVELVGRGAARLFGSTSTVSLSARHRMSDLLKEGAHAGVLSATQTALLDRALALRSGTVATEMIPWSNVQTLPEAASPADLTAVAHASWTRLPVVNADGRVTGALNSITKGLRPEASLEDLLEPVARCTPDEGVPDVLTRLRRSGHALGIVERNGTPVGLVTAKDLVETLTGELHAW